MEKFFVVVVLSLTPNASPFFSCFIRLRNSESTKNDHRVIMAAASLFDPRHLQDFQKPATRTLHVESILLLDG